jgi:ArsR family transcriptional regulator
MSTKLQMVPVVGIDTPGSQAACGLPTRLRFDMDQADGLAALAKALGHPVRIQIVDLLSRYEGEVCVCEIERHFSLTQPTISHHLKVLRDVGLIDSEQRGLWVYYHLNRRALAPLRDLLHDLDE